MSVVRQTAMFAARGILKGSAELLGSEFLGIGGRYGLGKRNAYIDWVLLCPHEAVSRESSLASAIILVLRGALYVVGVKARVDARVACRLLA